MERLRRYESTFHQLGQHRVGGGPDSATGETYCTAHHLLVDSGTRTDNVMRIRYADEFVRTGEGWRISARILHVDWSELRTLD